MSCCVVCGEVSEGTRCPAHTRRTIKRSARDRGYTAAWDELSRRARRLQPFCSDCGTGDDLTADHSPEAWQRQAAGLPIRLTDVDVVCRPCNARRGPARPGGMGLDGRSPDPRGRQSFNHTRSSGEPAPVLLQRGRRSNARLVLPTHEQEPAQADEAADEIEQTGRVIRAGLDRPLDGVKDQRPAVGLGKPGSHDCDGVADVSFLVRGRHPRSLP